MRIVVLTLVLAAHGPALTAAISPPTRINPLDGQRYVWLPSGTYSTGCSSSDRDCIGWERPRHEVLIRHGFWIAQTEVTQAVFRRIAGWNPSRYPGPDRPVEQIDWTAARAFCRSVGMRLPTEDEWEYAAAGGLDAPRYGPIDTIAWFDGNSKDQTHSVASKRPNAYDLYDMLGNVWEWVEDSFSPDPHRRIMKGGSFYNLPRDLRVPNRETPVVDLRHRNVGFRCVGDTIPVVAPTH